MPPAHCFVLDLDDTLYPERDYVRSGFSAVDALVTERLDLQGFGDACWQAFRRGERRRIFDDVLQSMPGSANRGLVAELVQVYRLHEPRIKLYPDARRFIAGAHKLGRPLALITDGPRQSQWAKIDALKLREKFSPIVVTDDLGPGKSKPHPASFELVEQTLGRGLQYVYIADNPNKDFLAPNRLGWMSIRIQRSGSLHGQAIAPSPEHAAQHTVTSLDNVWQLYKQQGPAMRQGLARI